jgi:hypothetical protein
MGHTVTKPVITPDQLEAFNHGYRCGIRRAIELTESQRENLANHSPRANAKECAELDVRSFELGKLLAELHRL